MSVGVHDSLSRISMASLNRFCTSTRLLDCSFIDGQNSDDIRSWKSSVGGEFGSRKFAKKLLATKKSQAGSRAIPLIVGLREIGRERLQGRVG